MADLRTALDAETDQALALFRHKRHALTDDAGRIVTDLAEGMAEQLREQFPDTPGLGRIVMAVAQQIGVTDVAICDALGSGLPVITLVTIAGLAAEQLEREP